MRRRKVISMLLTCIMLLTTYAITIPVSADASFNRLVIHYVGADGGYDEVGIVTISGGQFSDGSWYMQYTPDKKSDVIVDVNVNNFTNLTVAIMTSGWQSLGNCTISLNDFNSQNGSIEAWYVYGKGITYTKPTTSPTSPTPPTPPTPPAPPTPTKPPTFQNVSVHDPSVIKVDQTYYVFGSHLGAAKTNDFIKWTLIDSGVSDRNVIIPNVTKELSEALTWAQTKTLWAPDVIQLNDGKYYMYYNACEGSQPLSALGLAVSNKVEGPYKDLGIFLKSGMYGQISNDGTNYNANVHPNAVDPSVFFDKNGELWMVYGSYSGGIFIMKLNPKTGFPLPGQGYGKRLMGEKHLRIEGAYMIYSPETNYYYLYVTFGGLDSSGGYNLRVSRSLTPDGDFKDVSGKLMKSAKVAPGAPFFDDASIEPYGLKVVGNFVFSNLDNVSNFPTYGYVSPGHNSIHYDAQTGKYFNIFHTRFPNRGEAHEVRVHQMFMNKEGWPVMTPHRYAGETIKKVQNSEIVGSYHFINHGKAISPDIQKSVYVELRTDGTISGSVTGTWSLSDNYYARLVMNETVAGQSVQNTYDGVFIHQWDPTRSAYVMTFSAASREGKTIWGSQLKNIR